MIKDTSPRVDVTKLPFDILLKPHQAALVYHALEVEKHNAFGIMGDIPGCGKTYAILSLIYLDPRGLGPTIIVVPHNIYSQWLNSIETFIGNRLKWKCFADYADITSLYYTKSLQGYDILLTTSMYFNIVSTTLSTTCTPVYRVVFDEADTISNMLQNPLKTDKTWFVSASIDRLINSNKGRIGQYLVPDVEKVKCMCDPVFIEQSMRFEDVKSSVHVIQDVYIDELLRHVVDDMTPIYANTFKMPFMSNRKASDPRDYTRSFYNHIHDEIVNVSENVDRLTNDIIILHENDQDLHVGDLESHRQELVDKLNDYTRKAQIVFDVAKQHGILDDVISNDTSNYEYESKVENIKDTIKKILDSNESPKIIVFSQHYDCLAQLYTEIPRQMIVELDGGSVERMNKVVAHFRDPSHPTVMLMDSTVFGVGLDLELTTDILFAHGVDALIEKQVMGRALRMSRDARLPLRIHKFMYVSET